jgi:hypothetical protein
MGGGKTHLLVGFGLLAKHPVLRKQYCGGLPYAQDFEAADIAAFNGRNNPDHFFWGEVATQLGKGEQFTTFWSSGPKAPDEKDWLKLFDGCKPILILLDEMPPYFHYLNTQKVGNGTVADIATRAFANLITAAGKKRNVCVVVSDLAASYDTGTRLINRALEDARAELGRQERNITPVRSWRSRPGICITLRRAAITSIARKTSPSSCKAWRTTRRKIRWTTSCATVSRRCSSQSARLPMMTCSPCPGLKTLRTACAADVSCSSSVLMPKFRPRKCKNSSRD